MNNNLTFLLLGNFAKKKKQFILQNLNNINIIESFHPSPLGANKGFLGSEVFTKINSILKEDKINWINL